MKIIFEKVHPAAKMPAKKNHKDAGMDLSSVEELTIAPGEYKLVDTGLRWCPEGDEVIELQVRPRSGLAIKNGITVLNSPGTVDHNYRDNIKVILINHGKYPFSINIGDRIAQAVISKVTTDFEIVEGSISYENNRNGGFGSTGVK